MQRASNSSTQPLIRVSGEIKHSKYQRYFLFSRLFTLPHQFWVSGSCGCWMIKLVAFEVQTYFRSQLLSFVGREATTRNASALRRLLNWLLKLLRSNRQITPPNIILEGQFYEAEFEKNSGTNSTNWKNVVKKRALVKLASLTSSSRRAVQLTSMLKAEDVNYLMGDQLMSKSARVTWNQAQFERFSYILSDGYRWNCFALPARFLKAKRK